MGGQEDLHQGKLRSKVFAASPHGYLILDPELTIVDVNDRYLAMTGSQASDLIGQALFDAFPDDPADAGADGTQNLGKSLEIVIKSEKPHRMAIQKYNIPVRDSATGAFEERYWQPLNTPVLEDGVLIAIIHHVEDVTSEFLGRRDQAIQLRLATQVSGVGYSELDIQTGTANVSYQLADLFGYSDIEGTVPSDRFFERVHSDDLPQVEKAIAEATATGGDHAIVNIDYRIVLPGDEIRWLNTRGEVLHEHGKAARFIGVTIDLTHAKRREEILKETLVERDKLLKQKEILLGDVNHRIKNSLHLVSSILRIEAGSTDDDNVRASLQQASRRVHAVSSVHELIYKSQNVTHVDVGEYVPQLVEFLATSLTTDASNIEMVAHADSIILPTDTAISLALLTNELVTNAYKHAFTGREQGRVEVSLRLEGAALRLTVVDNGVGLGATTKNSGLGSKIVAGIVGQLGANTKKEATEGGYRTVIEMLLPTG